MSNRYNLRPRPSKNPSNTHRKPHIVEPNMKITPISNATDKMNLIIRVPREMIKKKESKDVHHQGVQPVQNKPVEPKSFDIKQDDTELKMYVKAAVDKYMSKFRGNLSNELGNTMGKEFENVMGPFISELIEMIESGS